MFGLKYLSAACLAGEQRKPDNIYLDVQYYVPKSDHIEWKQHIPTETNDGLKHEQSHYVPPRWRQPTIGWLLLLNYCLYLVMWVT